MSNVLRKHYPEIFGNQLHVNLHADIEKYKQSEEQEKVQNQENEQEIVDEKTKLTSYERAVIRVNNDGLFCWRGGGFV